MHLETTAWSVAAVGLLAYLVGGVPVGYVLVRLRHPHLDVRALGSGNVGTSNIYRNADAGIAAVVGPLQFAQGLGCALLPRALDMPVGVQALCAVCAVIGNGWPVYLGFNGGRGIAVATGAVAALSPRALVALLVCYALGFAAGEIAAGVLTGFLILPPVAAVWIGPGRALAFTAVLGIIVLRRLEGVTADLRASARPLVVIRERLIHDRRPGRPLVGRRTDVSAR